MKITLQDLPVAQIHTEIMWTSSCWKCLSWLKSTPIGTKQDIRQ